MLLGKFEDKKEKQEEKDNKRIVVKPKECPNCGHTQHYDTLRCPICGKKRK